ncbi:MAG: hypothetical protein MSA09_08400 [Lachnospiraceae bacterium]|nr:hypothetical protein [Lachnospiraceae bacterium]MDD7178207.1 hypothetical protein [bacterium]MDY5516341.1 hypothetical protein [Lachnospiraceae bacterium]
MSIFFWFLIIAVATLAVNMINILHMRKQKSVRIFPVFVILCAGYLAAALLYLVTVMQGTQVLEKRQAASLEIDASSYQATSDDTHTSYTFCSKEGISFAFDDSALLVSDVPKKPSVIEVYFCKTRNGSPSCYLSEGSAVYYILK